MKVLLYGAKGWIGGQFIDLLANNNIEYIFKNIKQLFSNYNFNVLELLLLLSIILVNIKNKNYSS